MKAFSSFFQVNVLSCSVSWILSLSALLNSYSLSFLDTKSKTYMIGSMMKQTNDLLRGLPDSLNGSFLHFLVSGSKQLSPQSLFIISFSGIPYFLLQILAKVLNVKAHWSFPAPKATFPKVGSITRFPISSFSQAQVIELNFSMILTKFWQISSPLSLSQTMALSTLLMIKVGLILSCMACLNTVSVWTQIPSTVSTTTRAPSVTLRAAVTSELKSTWPGESIRLIKNFLSSALSSSWQLKHIDTPVDLMVIPFSISFSPLSVQRPSPALS